MFCKQNNMASSGLWSRTAANEKKTMIGTCYSAKGDHKTAKLRFAPIESKGWHNYSISGVLHINGLVCPRAAYYMEPISSNPLTTEKQKPRHPVMEVRHTITCRINVDIDD